MDISDDPAADDYLLPVELYPEFSVRVAVFEDCTNASQLVQQVIGGEIAGDLALVDANFVVSVRILRQAATNCARRAATAAAGRDPAVKAHDLPRARTRGADLVYALAPATSIGGAFKDCGASAATTRLLVCAVSSTPADFRALLERVAGRQVALAALDARSAAADEALVKLFRLSAEERRDVERAILTRLATKDLVSKEKKKGKG